MATTLLSSHSRSLPTPRTRLIGRAGECEAARRHLLDEAAPLLTLTGPGGVGKTRLALAVAHDVAAHFADGVAWVDLAPLTDPAMVGPAIAAAIGLVPESDAPPVAELARYLRSRQALLLVDNCEHLLAETATLLADLLARCPAVQVLATSRATLRVRGEQALPVPPLPLPTDDAVMETIARNEAVALFAERAHAADPTFSVTPANAPQVAALCRKLDGLPLAIELAAARSSLLTPEALASDLGNRLRSLGGGPRDLPARQQTIEATIAWSHALLDERAQALFRRLAVFLGGFTLEAAEWVVGGGACLDLLATLLEHNLVRRAEIGAEPRYTMLETIRAFALERLEEAGEREGALDAHAAYVLARVGNSHPLFSAAPDRTSWMATWASIGEPNFRAAMDRLADAGNADGVLRLAISLARTWEMYVAPHEGRRWLEWALARCDDTPSAPRGHALAALAQMHWGQGRYQAARPLAEASLAIAEQRGDARIGAYAYYVLGNIALSEHRYREAVPPLEAAHARWQQHKDGTMEAVTLQVLAGAEHGLGDDEAAVRHATEALALFRELGIGEASALARLGRIARDQGNDRGAALTYREMLPLYAKDRSLFSLVQAFAGLGELASRHGQAEIGATLVGVIDAIVHNAGATRIPPAQVNYDRTVGAARGALGEARFAQLQAVGRALRLDNAIGLARLVAVPMGVPGDPDPAWLSSGAGSSAGGSPSAAASDGTNERRLLAGIVAPQPAPASLSLLTCREQEVLALLGQRLTDIEIAERLFISRKTASNHVSGILAKLGATNRREATASAARQGLL